MQINFCAYAECHFLRGLPMREIMLGQGKLKMPEAAVFCTGIRSIHIEA